MQRDREEVGLQWAGPQKRVGITWDPPACCRPPHLGSLGPRLNHLVGRGVLWGPMAREGNFQAGCREPPNHARGIGGPICAPKEPADLTSPIQPLFANCEVGHGARNSGCCHWLSLHLPPRRQFWGREGTVVSGHGHHRGLASVPSHPPPPQLCKLDVSLFQLDLPSPGCRVPHEPPRPVGPGGQPGPSRGCFSPWALVWTEWDSSARWGPRPRHMLAPPAGCLQGPASNWF